MSFDEYEQELASISLKQAMSECRHHGALATVCDDGTALLITDAHSVYSGDTWGKVRVTNGTVPARAVLAVLGY